MIYLGERLFEKRRGKKVWLGRASQPCLDSKHKTLNLGMSEYLFCQDSHTVLFMPGVLLRTRISPSA